MDEGGTRARIDGDTASPLLAIDEPDEALSLVPMAGRRALDRAGRKLSLSAWQALPMTDRIAIVRAGAAVEVPVDAVRAIADRAVPAATEQPAIDDPPADDPPAGLVAALGAERPLSAETWRGLGALARFALANLHRRQKPERLHKAYDGLLGPRPTHLDERGNARMVSVGGKAVTERRAVASAIVRMAPATLERVSGGGAPKGDVFGVARIAGIQAAKRTHELIPLCHAVALTRVEVAFERTDVDGEVRIRATADATDRTGVEMEAMVAASTAALTVYDMIKGIDRWATIAAVQLDEKTGGRSGRLVRSVS